MTDSSMPAGDELCEHFETVSDQPRHVSCIQEIVSKEKIIYKQPTKPCPAISLPTTSASSLAIEHDTENSNKRLLQQSADMDYSISKTQYLDNSSSLSVEALTLQTLNHYNVMYSHVTDIDNCHEPTMYSPSPEPLEFSMEAESQFSVISKKNLKNQSVDFLDPLCYRTANEYTNQEKTKLQNRLVTHLRRMKLNTDRIEWMIKGSLCHMEDCILLEALSLTSHMLNSQKKLVDRLLKFCEKLSNSNILIANPVETDLATEDKQDSILANNFKNNKSHELISCIMTAADKKSAFNTQKRIHKDSFPCLTCGKIYQYKRNLITHKKLHLGFPAQQHKCIVCDKCFSSPKLLKQHNFVHMEERPFSCSKCNKSFRQLCALNNHLKFVHSDIKRFKCSICQKLFKHKKNLNCHLHIHILKQLAVEGLPKVVDKGNDAHKQIITEEKIGPLQQSCWQGQQIIPQIIPQTTEDDQFVADTNLTSICLTEELNKREFILLPSSDLQQRKRLCVSTNKQIDNSVKPTAVFHKDDENCAERLNDFEGYQEYLTPTDVDLKTYRNDGKASVDEHQHPSSSEYIPDELHRLSSVKGVQSSASAGECNESENFASCHSTHLLQRSHNYEVSADTLRKEDPTEQESCQKSHVIDEEHCEGNVINSNKSMVEKQHNLAAPSAHNKKNQIIATPSDLSMKNVEVSEPAQDHFEEVNSVENCALSSTFGIDIKIPNGNLPSMSSYHDSSNENINENVSHFSSDKSIPTENNLVIEKIEKLPFTENDSHGLGLIQIESIKKSPIAVLKCQFCSKYFKYKSKLIVHERTHLNNKLYECDICHNKFTTIGNVNRHKLQHDKDKKFKCHFCEKKFARKGYVSSHEARKHGSA